MSQTVRAIFGAEYRELVLPGPDEMLLRGICWGAFDEIYSPAFWASQVWLSSQHDITNGYRLGNTLREEAAACILGGFGFPAEVGVAAFERLRAAGLLEETATENELASALSQPLRIGARTVRYRFPRQKARYLAETLQILKADVKPVGRTARQYRDWLSTLPGIGLKTASWIVRNQWDSDDVAILDIHILRAGRLASVFPGSLTVERNYRELEDRFIDFATGLRVRPSRLDAVMWDFMRQTNRLALSALERLSTTPN